jgi:hypothetical protein
MLRKLIVLVLLLSTVAAAQTSRTFAAKNSDNTFTGTNAFTQPLNIKQLKGVNMLTADDICAAGNFWIAPIAGAVNKWRKCENGVLSDVGSGSSGPIDFSQLTGTATDAQIPDSITIDLAALASALAANGSNCGAGQASQGVDAAGNAEGCFTPSGSGTVSSATTGQVAIYTASTTVGGDPDFTYDPLTNTLQVGAVQTTGGGYSNLPTQADSTNTGDYWRNGADLKYHDGTAARTLLHNASVLPGANVSGAVPTATALAANGSNCGTGQASQGTDAFGNAEGCFTPTSGSGGGFELLSTPKTCTTMPANSTGNYSNTCFWTADINGSGAPIMPDANYGMTLRYETGTTANTNKGIETVGSNFPLRVGDRLRLQWLGHFGYTMADRRFFIGFTDQTGATMLAGDDPAGNWAGFAFCNDAGAACDADQTNFQCVLKDGTTRNRIDSGVVAATDTRYGLEIKESPAGTWHWYIKTGTGSLTEVCGTGTTTNAPTSGTGTQYVVGLQNLSTANEQIFIEGLQYWMDK